MKADPLDGLAFEELLDGWWSGWRPNVAKADLTEEDALAYLRVEHARAMSEEEKRAAGAAVLLRCPIPLSPSDAEEIAEAAWNAAQAKRLEQIG